MAHITLNSDEPGIRGLFRFRPETARPISALVEVLLRGPSSLTPGERELIAAQVSRGSGLTLPMIGGCTPPRPSASRRTVTWPR